jgi:hypothetical protein
MFIKKIFIVRAIFYIKMFSHEKEALLKKANVITSDLMYTLQEDFGDVLTVVYNEVYEELRIEEMDKKK